MIQKIVQKTDQHKKVNARDRTQNENKLHGI